MTTDVKKKIIFILQHPPTIDFKEKFFVEHFRKEGFKVEYWDLSSIFGHGNSFVSDATDLDCRKVLNLKEFGLKVKRESGANAILVLQMPRTLQTYPVFLLVEFIKVKTVYFARGYLPMFNRSEKTMAYYLNKIFKTNIKTFLSMVRSTLFKILPIAKRYDLVFTAGILAEKIHSNDAISIVKIHHTDIDCAINSAKSPSGLSGDYCVFIDDYIPFHPDFGMLGSPTVNAVNYYASLNHYFDLIENKYTTKIVVAAHPKAVYRTNPYNNRPVIFNATSALSKNARIVFTHASSAISYAVIYEKPLCLIVSDEIKRIHPFLHNVMLKTAELLDCPVVDFELYDGSVDVFFVVNKEKYKNYYTEYLSNTNSANCSSKIAIDGVKALLAGTLNEAV